MISDEVFIAAQLQQTLGKVKQEELFYYNQEKMPVDGKNSVGKHFSDAELVTMAKEIINEDPRNRETDLKAIKEWIKKQPHLSKYIRQDDDFLLWFLRGTKFSLEKAKEKIENWNTIRSMCPEFFTQWDPEEKKNDYMIKRG